MNWLRKLFRRQKRATLVLTMKFGTKIEVGTIICPICQNYFFAAHLEIEKPTFCPFCGVRFGGFTRNDHATESCIV
jgi:rubrerythrin